MASKLYLSVEETNVRRLQPGAYSLPHVRISEKSLASHVLRKRCVSLVPINSICDYLQTSAERLWTAVPTFPVPHSMTSISLDPLSSTWLVNDLQERLTWRKLSDPGCNWLTSVSSTLGYGGTNASGVMGDYVEVWCVPSATHMSCILCKIQTEDLGIRGLVTLFSITPLYMYVCM